MNTGNRLYRIISNNNRPKIKRLLTGNPARANMSLRCGLLSEKAHPLHRICDAVFFKYITDEQAVEIAKIFLEFGSNVDGYKAKGDYNTPLLVAASLHAEKLGIFYLEQGADIFFEDNEGATALHWASFCGRDKLVKKLIDIGANVNQKDKEHKSTPIGWANHCININDTNNLYHQRECIDLLLKAGAID